MTKHAQIIYLELFILRWDEVMDADIYIPEEKTNLDQEYGEFLEMEGLPPMSADELQIDLIYNNDLNPYYL